MALLLALALAGFGGAAVPPSEAELEHFRRVVPLSNASEEADAADEAAEAARLGKLNPGREGEVRAILETGLACTHEIDQRFSAQTLRAAAVALGRDKVERLILLYESPEFPALRRSAQRVRRGEKPGADELAAANRAQAAYPLAELDAAVRAKAREPAATRALVEGYDRCWKEQKSALARAKLRRN